MARKDIYTVIDLKSFYASCECADRGLDIFETPLVVCDPERSDSTIVMSTTPYLKEKFGVPNVCRRRDLPKLDNLILAQPRMAYYIEISAKVVSIFLDFVSEEDLHVYSIDESFLNIGPYLKLAGCSAKEYVSRIQKRIKDELGLVATSGIAPNMFLAKVALDNEGKKRPPYIAEWDYKDVEAKLWKISPISKLWGIGPGTEAHLKRIGIRSVRQLAKTDLSLLEKEFGIMGKQLHDLANGVDPTDIREKYIPKETNLSIGQTLSRDYDVRGTRLLIREMCDDLCLRMRQYGQKAGQVSLFVGYSAAFGGGFSHQAALNKPTDDNDVLFEALLNIYDAYVEDEPIRNLGLSFGKLSSPTCEQLDLFLTAEEVDERRKLYETLDEIAKEYGRDACLRASSLTSDSTIKQRHQQIGGHKA